MHVAEILAKKGGSVITVGPDDTIATAASVLAERRFGALVVSSDGVSIEGIISERDLVRGLSAHGGSVENQPVSAHMTSPVKTCSASDSVDDLMEQMTEHRIRHLPVVDGDGRMTGMISIGDVVKWRVSELEAEARHLEGYISGTGYV